MNAHTPGPWSAFRLVGEDGEPLRDGAAAEYVAACIAKRPGEDFFCVAPPGEGTPDICHTGNGPTSAVNARLIAAAPDLLEACRMVAEMAVGWEPLTPGDIAEVKAAIAKAEGR